MAEQPIYIVSFAIQSIQDAFIGGSANGTTIMADYMQKKTRYTRNIRD